MIEGTIEMDRSELASQLQRNRDERFRDPTSAARVDATLEMDPHDVQALLAGGEFEIRGAKPPVASVSPPPAAPSAFPPPPPTAATPRCALPVAPAQPAPSASVDDGPSELGLLLAGDFVAETPEAAAPASEVPAVAAPLPADVPEPRRKSAPPAVGASDEHGPSELAFLLGVGELSSPVTSRRPPQRPSTPDPAPAVAPAAASAPPPAPPPPPLTPAVTAPSSRARAPVQIAATESFEMPQTESAHLERSAAAAVVAAAVAAPAPLPQLTPNERLAAPLAGATKSEIRSALDATMHWAPEESVDLPSMTEIAPPASPSARAAFDARNLTGKVLGNCRLESELGRGAMGIVYEARHLSLDRRVAVKVLLPDRAHGEIDAERFVSEARALASSEHPNIVQVHDVGSHEGLHYIVMQLLEGASVAELLRQRRRLDWQEACRIARETASGLDLAHSGGIVHRDIKPENLMLTSQLQVKVADFGLAARASSADDARPTEVVGTPSYMAPEQIDGRHVDGRADLYSLGCALYEMLSGRKPFVGETAMDVLLMQTRATAVPLQELLPDVPVPVSQLVEKCMAKSPDARYQSASDLVTDLDSILGGGKPRIVVEIENVMNRMQAINGATQRRVPRSRGVLTVAAGALFVAVSVVSMSIAIPALPKIDVSEYAVAVAVAAPSDRRDEQAAADQALREAIEFARLNPDAVSEFRARFSALKNEHGEFLGTRVATALDSANGNFETHRESQVKKAIESSQEYRAQGDPIRAVDTLLALPEDFAREASVALLTAELGAAFSDVREQTDMAYVPGSVSPIGAASVPTQTAGFLMDLVEVSNGEYAKFVAETGARQPSQWHGPRPPQQLRHVPVVGVTRAEAAAYAAWIGKRLPTSVEWEKAARGGDGRRYPWGDEFVSSACVCRGGSATELQSVRALANGRSIWGVYNLAGNAAEWTADRVTLPDGSAAAIVRGGSLRSLPANVTTYATYPIPETTKDPAMLIGFRCVKDVR